MAWLTSTTPLLLLAVVVLAAVAQTTQATRPRQVAGAADPPSSPSVETLSMSINLAFPGAGADGHSPAPADHHVATKMERVEDDDESSFSLQAPAASAPDVPAPPKDGGGSGADGGIAGLFAGLWRRFWRLDEPYHRAVPGIKGQQFVGDRDGLN
ncbi:hypothetical protein ACP4OV_010291 [Aristida adscensionis]